MSRIAIVAALQREIASLVKGWQSDPALAKRNIFVSWNENVVVACAGMGAARVALAVEAAIAHGPVTEIWSVGFAGACNPHLRAGNEIHAGVVIDAMTGERSETEQGTQVLVTVETPASVAEKARLVAAYSLMPWTWKRRR